MIRFTPWCIRVEMQRGVNHYWHKMIRRISVRELQIVTLVFIEIYSKTKRIKLPYKPLFEKGFKSVFLFCFNTFLIKPKR